MARYIDADDLANIMVALDKHGYLKRIDAPTADVEEVRHSWLEMPTELSESICHLCRKPPKMLFGVLPNYCPHCGAIFDGKESKNEH